MLGSLLKEAAGVVDRRLYLNVFLPMLAALSAIAVAVAQAGPGLSAAVRGWSHQTTEIKSLQVAASVACTAIASGMVSSNATRIVRFFEGYWRFPGARRLVALGVASHQKRLDDLAARIAGGDAAKAAAAFETVSVRYPPPTQPNELMPTRLGNVLKNAELYPRDRYNIDAVLTWPRLYPLLPDRFVALFAASRAELDRSLTLTALGSLVTLIAPGCVLLRGGSWLQYILWLAGGSLLTRLMYLTALSNAVVYGQQIKTAFDLYRSDLLTKVWPDPDKKLDEDALWSRLADQWYRSVALDALRPDDEAIVITPIATPPTPTDPPRRRLPRLRYTQPTISGLLAIAVVLLGSAGTLLLSLQN